MKTLLKAIIPVFIISIALTILFIPTPVEAAKQESGYAVWKNEEAYIANPGRPDTRVEGKKLDPSLLASGGFVFCYGDVEVTEDVGLSLGAHMTIDLDGHTLTASKKIQVNNPSASSWRTTGSLRIRNGKIVHASNQFIQPRPCSEVYLENLIIDAQIDGSNFITESSSRIILFKNCTINFASTAKGGFIATMAGFDATKADIDNGKIDYVRNIVFENTVINDGTAGLETSNLTIIAQDDRTQRDILNISFVGNSTFNSLTDRFFRTNSTVEGNTINVNIGNGVRFAEPKVPINTRSLKINYYDSIVVDGNKVIFGNKTELLTDGEEQDPDFPKLIWGRSASEKYPYQLCTALSKVVWVSKDKNNDGHPDETEPVEYAAGVVLSFDKSSDTEGIKMNRDENGNVTTVTLESHVGWSASSDGANPTEYVTLLPGDNKFYAVFASNVVSAVEFTDATMTTPVKGIVGNNITADDFDSFNENSYIVFYDNMVFSTDDTYSLTKDLTVDLNGKKFSKNFITVKNSGTFLVKGKSLTVKNGSVSSSLTSFANVSEGGSVTLDNVALTFDTTPAFIVTSGTVSVVNGTKLESITLDKTIPAFAISSLDVVTVNADGCIAKLNGPFAVLSANNGVFAEANINVANCNNLSVDAIVTVYDYSADAFPEDASVNVSLDNVLLKSREVFDIGTRYNNTSALDVYATVNDNCFFTAKPEVLSGELILPVGTTVLGFNQPGNDFSYKIAAIELPNMMFNLSLKDSFTANLYIARESALTSAMTYIDTAPVSKELLPVTAVDGVAYYVVSVSGINPSSILNAIEIKLSYLSSVDGIEYTAELEYFVTDYLDNLLNETDPLDKKLAAAAINYINSAYEYCDIPVTDEFAELLSDDRYLDVLRPKDDLPNAVSAADMGNISVAFKGAQLYMSSDLSIRFNLRESFSGTLLIDGHYYTVTDGKHYVTEGTRRVEYSYIQIQVLAYSFYDEIVEVSGNSLDGTVISGSYSLIDYVNAQTSTENSALNFILSFYRYCYEANVYENNGVIPPVNDHTPPLDVEWR